MNMTTRPVPVLIGGDLNCYNVARAFFEAYRVRSYVFGRYETSAVKASKLIHFIPSPNMDDPEIFVSTLLDFAKEHPQKNKILIGCTDEYVRLIIKNRDKLKNDYLFSCADGDISDILSSKERFYELCFEKNIPYPKSYIFSPDMMISESCLSERAIGFSYPIVIKPSVGYLYRQYPFANMKNVYIAKNEEDAKRILDGIFQSGYPQNVIIQDYIPGDDDCIFVLTCYSDQSGKVRMSCLGHVLVDEHNKKGFGNHAAIISEKHPEIVKIFKNFLEDIGYRGFSNFDIKYDARTKTFAVLEMNLRQSHSNYYVTAQGFNIAKLLVSDLINGAFEDEYLENTHSVFWSSVPKKIVYDYTRSYEMVKMAKILKKHKFYKSSLWYAHDLLLNPRRLFYVSASSLNHFLKFRKYLAKPQR